MLANEMRENPNVLFRIWETTVGRYDKATFRLGLILDEATEDDEHAFCCGMHFIASRDFLELRGEPHIFCIFLDENLQIGVYAF